MISSEPIVTITLGGILFGMVLAWCLTCWIIFVKTAIWGRPRRPWNGVRIALFPIGFVFCPVVIPLYLLARARGWIKLK